MFSLKRRLFYQSFERRRFCHFISLIKLRPAIGAKADISLSIFYIHMLFFSTERFINIAFPDALQTVQSFLQLGDKEAAKDFFIGWIYHGFQR